jgi:hypothetical protein
MRSSVLWVLAVAAVVCIPFTLSQSQQPINASDSVWFVLSNESGQALRIDPAFRIAGKRLLEPPAYCDDVPENDEFGKTYLRPGRSYTVSFGGARAGSLSFKVPKPNEYVLGAFEYQGTAPIVNKTSALATNGAVDSSRQNTRQAPTTADLDAALSKARMLFAKAGVPTELLAKVTLDELTRTTLFPDKTSSLVGSFVAPTGGELDPIHSLFLVAKQPGHGLVTELAVIRIAKSPTDNEILRFVDQADLFGNGEDEIVAVNGYYENYRYRVFGRNRNGKHWKQIFETEILGCE